MTINEIVSSLSNVSLSKQRGRFLSDKSYGFDTVYFIAKFILHNSVNLRFNKLEIRNKAIKYIEDLFQLKQGTAGAVNYYLETINLLTYGNVLSTDNEKDYFISQKDVLQYISSQPENAYIYVYLLTYITFKNDGLLPLFEKYASKTDLEEKGTIVKELYKAFAEKSVSIIDEDTNWSKQMVKYAIIVLGYANNQNYVSRTLIVKNKTVTIEDISLNVSGTRTPIYLPKKNDYLQTFNSEYVKYHLKGFLLNHVVISMSQIATIDSIARSLADLKLAMLDDTIGNAPMSDFDKQQYLDTVVRTRNQSVQNQFRKGLLITTNISVLFVVFLLKNS